MATIKQLLADGKAALSESDSARLDAEVLLACVLKRTRSWLYAWPDFIPALPEQHLYMEFIRQRQEGTPVGYLTGRKEFWDMELEVNDEVLIPRPETETLVETALEKLGDQPQARIADLGTGTGAIALALAGEKQGWRITATEISLKALALAQKNAKKFQIENVEFVEGDWIVPLGEEQYDAILSNPPYVDVDDPHLKQGDLRFEPSHTLISADNGLADIRKIVTGSPHNLKPGGWLMVEHAYNQGEAVRKIFTEAGLTEIETVRDLSGNERVTIGRKT